MRVCFVCKFGSQFLLFAQIIVMEQHFMVWYDVSFDLYYNIYGLPSHQNSRKDLPILLYDTPLKSRYGWISLWWTKYNFTSWWRSKTVDASVDKNLNYNDIIPLLSHAIIMYLCCLFKCWLCSIFYFYGNACWFVALSENNQFNVHFGAHFSLFLFLFIALSVDLIVSADWA